VLSGCDAHSFADLDENSGRLVSDATVRHRDEPTWIKSDLTFEGLSRVIFEPANRYLSAWKPTSSDGSAESTTRYIESLHIDCVEGYRRSAWGLVPRRKIILGKELVAIIGTRAAERAQLTDIIGCLAIATTRRLGAWRAPSQRNFFHS